MERYLPPELRRSVLSYSFDLYRWLDDQRIPTHYIGRIQEDPHDLLATIISIADKAGNVCTKGIPVMVTRADMRNIQNPNARLGRSRNSLAIETDRGDVDVREGFGLYWNIDQYIEECTKPIIVIDVNIHERGAKYSHSNILIIDKNKKTFERFEPHGKYADPAVDGWLKYTFGKILPGYTYIPPIEVCPYPGPQVVTEAGIREEESDQAGFCYTWSMMYLHARLMNPYMASKMVVRQLLDADAGEMADHVNQYNHFLKSEGIRVA